MGTQMRNLVLAIGSVVAALAMDACGGAGQSLELFVGSATKPATEEAATVFENRYEVRVDLHFGGSGAMLSQMKLTGRGDIYFPGSSDFMEKAKREGIIFPGSERVVVYLIPAINVQRGNPKGIQSLDDLTMPDVRIAIARPKTVCVGLYAAEVLDNAGLSDLIRPGIATYAESCAKTAGLVALKSVDAVIGWRVFQYWAPEEIETVYLDPDQIPRIGYVPIAVAKSSKHPALARQFIDFVTSREGTGIYSKWHYVTSEEEARRFAPQAKVGGEWKLPEEWR